MKFLSMISVCALPIRREDMAPAARMECVASGIAACRWIIGSGRDAAGYGHATPRKIRLSTGSPLLARFDAIGRAHTLRANRMAKGEH
jgi:hypothetical protein